jgi:hypothetical protein
MKEKNNELIYEICKQYCKEFASDEMLILELNKSNLYRLVQGKRNKYEDALASGIGGEVLLPIVISILTTISVAIIKDGYELTKEKIKEYLEKKASNDSQDIISPKSKQESNTINQQIINIIAVIDNKK